MPSKNERYPSDGSDFRPPSRPDLRSAQFQEGVGSGGGSPYDHLGYNPSGLEFGSGGSGYKSSFDDRRSPEPSKLTGSLADHVKKQDVSDPRLISIAKTIDEFVEARVAQVTAELAAKLRTTEQTLIDLAGVANIATERITQAAKAQKAAEKRAQEAEAVAFGFAAKLALEKTARQNAEVRARIAEEEARRAKGSSGSVDSSSDRSWDPKGYYRILGINDPSVASRITSSQLDRLFRAQADVYHPDHDGGSDDHMKKLSAARDHLKDPLNRRSYGR